MFVEVYPGRAAGRHQRDRNALVSAKEFGEPFKELASFLHDGGVCREVGIKYIVESQIFKSRNHLAGNYAARSVPELFSKGNPHCWGNLYDHGLLRVLEIVYELVCISPFCKGSYRADGNALSAICAVSIFEHPVEGRGYGGIEAPSNCTKGSNCLIDIAHRLAPAAVDALVHVPYDGGCHLHLVDNLSRISIGIVDACDIEILVCQRLGSTCQVRNPEKIEEKLTQVVFSSLKRYIDEDKIFLWKSR